MAKLYPPYIEGTLPAFTLDSSGNGTITIPFELNRAVSMVDVKSAQIKVKTVQNDVLITSFGAQINPENRTISVSVKDGSIDKWTIKNGDYYKLQIAFVDTSGEIGYYSTVGVIKCTSKPTIGIEGFEESAINNNRHEFIGYYENSGDVTEKVYSSKFTIKDSEGNIIATTGDTLHNVENNPNSYSSTDTMIFNRDLEIGQIYTITYEVITNNGLVESITYYLEQPRLITSDLSGKVDIAAELNKEEGYIKLSLVSSNTEFKANGAFLISRQDNLNKGYWEPIYQFTLNNQNPNELSSFKDYTIEQGKTYAYTLQQYNEYGIYSDRMPEESARKPIFADFDDMFLYDGERQLKIQFNPQVSNFKTQLAETRTETIGSKYPFFFRNARVGYKTFPISGLISMFIDDNQEFITYDEILREDLRFDRHSTKSNRKEHPEDVYDQHWEIDHNFVSERLFKLAVLDWFNDGKVKLFKSPGEGNYLVRLMDASLTPQAPLGRMIHTVNATAYECADLNYESLIKYGIVKELKGAADVEKTYDTKVGAQPLSTLITGDTSEDKFPEKTASNENNGFVSGASEDVGQKVVSAKAKFIKDESSDYYYLGLLPSAVYYIDELKLEDFLPGTMFKLMFSNDTSFNNVSSEIIQIGPTGTYYASNVQPIYQVYLLQETAEPTSLSGVIQYTYKTLVHNEFDLITDTISKISSSKQFVGIVDDVAEALRTAKNEPLDITMANFKKRPIEYLFFKYEDFPYEEENFTGFEESLYVEKDYENNGEKITKFNDNGYRNLSEAYKGKLYWDNSFKEPFTHKSHMEYSPFSLYVLKSSLVETDEIDRKTNKKIKVDITGHINNAADIEDSTDLHIDNHMFEKYYIDRYTYAQSAEEALAAGNVYVVDPWEGKVYEPGTFTYNPTVGYYEYQKNDDGEIIGKESKFAIDLREIQRYDFDTIDPTNNTFAIGNGVYGEVIYNEIETTYSVESDPTSDVHPLKSDYENYKADHPNTTLTFEEQYQLEQRYNEFNKELLNFLEEWNAHNKE